MGLEITVAVDGTDAELWLSGELDVEAAEEVVRAVGLAAGLGCGTVLLDLGEAVFSERGAWDRLAGVQRGASAVGASVAFRAPSAVVTRLLRPTSWDGACGSQSACNAAVTNDCDRHVAEPPERSGYRAPDVIDEPGSQCHACGVSVETRYFVLTERDEESAAAGIWRICSWGCLGSLAHRKAGSRT